MNYDVDITVAPKREHALLAHFDILHHDEEDRMEAFSEFFPELDVARDKNGVLTLSGTAPDYWLWEKRALFDSLAPFVARGTVDFDEGELDSLFDWAFRDGSLIQTRYHISAYRPGDLADDEAA